MLFVNVLKSFVKWFFIFDQYNYSRWISVHLQDLLTLSVTCPTLYEEFVAGNFTAQITGRQFSRIYFDQAHEQSNKTIKSISGPIHFVNRSDENRQRRWEIAGPEIADFLHHVECELKGSNPTETHHYEDSPSHNAMFVKESSVILSRLLPINPFLGGMFWLRQKLDNNNMKSLCMIDLSHVKNWFQIPSRKISLVLLRNLDELLIKVIQ